ncbi:MAG: hypothetical protein HYU66_11315 [Armatimonadetes bacterium]|nr:hypothetical protein [Armatimonadota bacterium]
MASLQIRNLPDDVYEALKRLAEQERRSLSQQAVVTLQEGLAVSPEANRSRRRAVLERFRQLVPLGDTTGWADTTALIREDRDDPER